MIHPVYICNNKFRFDTKMKIFGDISRKRLTREAWRSINTQSDYLWKKAIDYLLKNREVRNNYVEGVLFFQPFIGCLNMTKPQTSNKLRSAFLRSWWQGSRLSNIHVNMKFISVGKKRKYWLVNILVGTKRKCFPILAESNSLRRWSYQSQGFT